MARKSRMSKQEDIEVDEMIEPEYVDDEDNVLPDWWCNIPPASTTILSALPLDLKIFVRHIKTRGQSREIEVTVVC
ncbi:hypothetical protein L6452_33721 [Arctium lappa]|uniref:Uncharacterized protein n=1 Tax=Arctium lappa TaxID=4217 RepID=A0ACB8YG55_ARCLA|nr:hypothetical protein L6452_33721 [Arctium lappa]